jgi:hypothetical protein
VLDSVGEPVSVVALISPEEDVSLGSQLTNKIVKRRPIATKNFKLITLLQAFCSLIIIFSS